MKDCGDHYEYLCTWVDDLLFASKDPMWLMKALQDKPYGYTLKGVGFPSYYLGADIKRVDKDVVGKGVLTMGNTTYVKRSLENYERIVGLKPPRKSHNQCILIITQSLIPLTLWILMADKFTGL